MWWNFAADQEKKYAEQLMDDYYQKVAKYGMAFYEKACKVKTSIENCYDQKKTINAKENAY